jgi:hypothetical protein
VLLGENGASRDTLKVNFRYFDKHKRRNSRDLSQPLSPASAMVVRWSVVSSGPSRQTAPRFVMALYF